MPPGKWESTGPFAPNPLRSGRLFGQFYFFHMRRGKDPRSLGPVAYVKDFFFQLYTESLFYDLLGVLS